MKRSLFVLVLLAGGVYGQAPPAPVPAAPVVTVPAAVDADTDNLDAMVPLTLSNVKSLAWRVPAASKMLVLPQYKPGEVLPWALYCVRAKVPGSWELIVTGVAGDKMSQVVCTITVGGTPPVPPGPTPPVPPVPPTPPSPTPTDGLRVLIVYPLGSLTSAQDSIIRGKKVRDWLEAKCIAEPETKLKGYRIWATGEDATGDLKVWQDAYARKRDSLPWIVIGGPKGGFEGPLPADEDAALSLLQKYGG